MIGKSDSAYVPRLLPQPVGVENHMLSASQDDLANDQTKTWQALVDLAERAAQRPDDEYSDDRFDRMLEKWSQWYHSTRGRWKYIVWPGLAVPMVVLLLWSGLRSPGSKGSVLIGAMAVLCHVPMALGLVVYVARLPREQAGYRRLERLVNRYVPRWSARITITVVTVAPILIIIVLQEVPAQTPRLAALALVSAMLPAGGIVWVSGQMAAPQIPLLNDKTQPSFKQWSQSRRWAIWSEVAAIVLVAASLTVAASMLQSPVFTFFSGLVVAVTTSIIISRLLRDDHTRTLHQVFTAAQNFQAIKAITNDPLALAASWAAVDATLSVELLDGVSHRLSTLASIQLRYALDCCALSDLDGARWNQILGSINASYRQHVHASLSRVEGLLFSGEWSPEKRRTAIDAFSHQINILTIPEINGTRPNGDPSQPVAP